MTTPNLLWKVEDKSYDKDDIVTAEFTVSNFSKISCYQFALLFDVTKLGFIGVEFPSDNPLALKSSLFSWGGKPGYKVKPNEIRHLASFPKGKTLADNTYVFSYVFKALEAGNLADNLSLSTCCLYPPMKPIAYNFPLNPQTLSVEFTELAEPTINIASLGAQSV